MNVGSDYLSRLYALEREIRIGIIGIGAMGKGLVYQCGITPGMRCVAIANDTLGRALECAKWLKRDYRVVSTLSSMHEAIEQGLLAICEDGELVAQCELVDIVIEATGAVSAGAQHSITALEHHKHLVMMNAEADLAFGPYLMKLAQKNQVVYTSCAGDQPVAIRQLADEIQFYGFELVVAGNIKGFLDRYSDPTKIIPEADKRGLNHRQATSYTDGTKLCIEMALVANAMGLVVSVPGMRGFRADHVRDALHLFDLRGIRQNGLAVVDYILGAAPGGGVFVIGYCGDDYQRSLLAYYKMGNGPFYLFYRPYHLGHIEALSSVASAVLDRRPLLQPTQGFKTNVYAYAKRDLRAGEVLDGIGGYTCYGLIENYSMEKEEGVPICFTEAMVLRRAVPQDRKILWKDVAYDPARLDLRVYKKAIGETRGAIE